MNKSEVAEMAEMKRGLKDLDRKVDTHIHEQREDFDKVFKKLDLLTNSFAGKWVERVTIGLMITVGGGVIVGVIMFALTKGAGG